MKRIQGLYPNAYSLYNGKRVKILEANILDNKECYSDKNNLDLIDKIVPGEILVVSKQTGITIMCSDYPIQIKYGQLEGKKATDSYTLSVQSNMLVSNIFGS